MKFVTAIIALVLAFPAFASVRNEYVPGRIVSIEEQPDSSGGTTQAFVVTYWLQPCAEKFEKLQEIRLPELEISVNAGERVVTDTSLVVVLASKGIQCAGPNFQAKVLYTPSSPVKNPRSLLGLGQN